MPQLYFWRSDYLRNWGRGWIVTTADNVEQARERARVGFAADYKYKNPFDHPDADDDDAIVYRGKLAEFEADIAKEPEVTAALFIGGSE